MSLQLFFDRQDREILRMINKIIDNGPSCDLEHRIFNSSLHPHGILNLTTTHAYRMAHAVINLLGSLSKASAPEDRLAALASLREEVLHSAQTTFRYNTGRVLIQIMKSIIRSRDDETEQLKLVHDFRMAASGNPRIVRRFLTRHYLMEMPEEWNQLTMDHHVHDANTKGRKNATFLIMDAWIKGIRYLTVVYYNYINPDVARELLGAAKIMGIDVRIGIEFKACFRRRYVNFVWTPRGFSDSETFLEFFASEPIVEFMREGRAVTLWEQQQVLATLGCWNRRHSIELSREFHIDAPQLDEAEFMAFVDKGQTSLLHLAEFAHKKLLPALRARVEELEKRIDEVDADSAITIADEIHVLDMLTPTALLHRYLNPDKNPTLPSTQSPADDDRPPLLKIEAKDLLEKLASLRSGYRITLQLSGLSSEDVLVLLWKGQGFITHLELFNMKEWKEGRLADLEAINELQLALNHGGVMHLKRILRGMEQALELSDDEDADERRREILEITANIRSLQSLYLQTPLYSQIGSDSTSHLGNRYGMGLAVAETLPSNARKRLSHNKRISTFKLPLNVRLYYRDTYRDEHRSPGENSIVGFVRNTLGFRRFGMTQKREWRAELDKVSIANSGNVITMGGLNPDVDNGLTVTSETAPVKSKGPGRDYYNTAYSNFLKVLIGFIPSAASFLYTQDWWFLAWF
ncbi:MAG: hypothetical protein MJ061_04425, partial [Mailhella sp.]|nr:hypothetical protein [Mailhella sp.]